MPERFEALREALLALEEDAALAATRRLVDDGVDPKAILEAGLAEAMAELGRRWDRGEVFLPEVVVAAEIFGRCNALVEPALLASGRQEVRHRAVMATVKGDLHDLGKNMVGAMLKTAGFEVHDLGKDVAAERIVEAVRELAPGVVGLSALLTTTVPQQRLVIEALEAAGLRSGVRVIVGGAPVTEEWAARIGADGFAPNAPAAVRLARDLVERVPVAGRP